MGIAEFLQCKGLLDTYFCLKPCYSSKDITMLVRSHVKNGWLNHIVDVESYWRFSDTRGHWALERNGCEGIFGAQRRPSMRASFSGMWPRTCASIVRAQQVLILKNVQGCADKFPTT